MKFMILIIMNFFIFMTGSVRADQLLWNENGVSKHFNSASAKELLSTKEYGIYRTLLKDLDCGPAALLLNRAFVKRYPQFSNAAAPRGTNFINWLTLYASTEFPDLSFCRNSLGLRTMEMEIAERGLPIGKYLQGDERKIPALYRVYSDEWQRRDMFVGGLIFQASRDHVPALFYLAKRLTRGDLFDVGPKTELYLLNRACHLVGSCASQKNRMNELMTLVPKQNRENILQTAQKKNIVYEILEQNDTP